MDWEFKPRDGGPDVDPEKVRKLANSFDTKYHGKVLTGRDALLDAHSADFIKEYVGIDGCTYAELAEGGRIYCENYGHPTDWCDHIQSGNAKTSDFNHKED